MRISEEGKQLIRDFEGLRLSAYRDAVGVLTIGYGHTRGVRRCRYNGQEYQSVSAMARALGLTYSTACALCEETQ